MKVPMITFPFGYNIKKKVRKENGTKAHSDSKWRIEAFWRVAFPLLKFCQTRNKIQLNMGLIRGHGSSRIVPRHLECLT